MARQVVYIHGFNSSELSFKATEFGVYMRGKPERYITPRLHFDPRVALAQLDSIIDSDTVLLGSSLGGYYATYFSQLKGCKAVVINPAVRPFFIT